jgi:enterochelin esterase-like enzyme
MVAATGCHGCRDAAYSGAMPPNRPGTPRLTRRKLIFGGVGALGAVAVGGWAALADARVVPGRSLIDHALGRCDLPHAPLDPHPGPLLDGVFSSARRQREVRYTIAYPPGTTDGAELPVCLLLHGYAANERTSFDGVGYHRMLATAVRSGAAPFALASVAGGDGYWHPHPGDDPLGMLLDEFPDVLARHGLRARRTDRLAVLGWSMGGSGALLSYLTAPQRFAAAVANAPAFWRSYPEAKAVNPGAFDSDEQWRQWGDLPARAGGLRGPGIWIEVGESDPFEPAVKALRGQMPDPSVVRIPAGCHDNAFWQHAAPAQLRFIADALVRAD